MDLEKLKINYFIQLHFTIIISVFIMLLSCTDPVQPPVPGDQYLFVSILSPVDESIISGTTTVSVQVVSNNAIQKVGLTLDQKEVALDTVIKIDTINDTTQYDLIWDTYNRADDKTHNLAAKVIDSTRFMRMSKSVSVFISSIRDSVIQLISPANHSIIRNSNLAEFTWRRSNLANNYEIQISRTNTFDEIVQSSLVADKSYLATNLMQETYYWRVRASFGDQLWGNWSQPWKITFDGPVVPSIIEPTSDSIVYGSTTFSWCKSEYTIDYEVGIFKTSPPYQIVYSSILSDSSTIVNLDLDKYFWKVRAINNVGFWSHWSDSVLFAYGIFVRNILGTQPSSTLKIIERDDSGFIILTGYPDSKLIGVSNTGILEWQTEFTAFGALDIEAGGNSNFLLVGNSYGLLSLAEVSSIGNTNWVKTFQDTADAYSRSIKRTKDGGFIIAASYCECNLGSTRVKQPVLYKIDANFNLEWKSTISSKIVVSVAVNETIDNGFLYFGETYYQSYTLTTIYIKTDFYGNVIWERMWELWNQPEDGISTVNNEHIAVGSTPGSAIWQKVNSVGSEVWYIQYSNGSRNAKSIVETDNGQYIIAGHGDNSSNRNIFLIKINESGVAEWEKRYPGYFGYSVIRTRDSGFCVVGSGVSSNGIMIIKTNNNGETFEP